MRFVIDHIGKPSIRDGQGTQAWAQAMLPFGDLPRVSCKLSGMVTEADWTH
jgi:L-fuconolactonase